MTSLLSKLTRHSAMPTTWDSYQSWIAQHGHKFPPGSFPVQISSNLAAPAATIDDMADAGSSNPIVAGAVARRSRLFSQWRPLWRRPDETTFTDAQLAKIQTPKHMPLTTFLDLAQQHDSYYGQAYVYDDPAGVVLLKPDRMQAVLSAPEGANASDPQFAWLPEAVLVGWLYVDYKGQVIRRYSTDEIITFCSNPDPVAWWRGRSWVTSLLRDIQNDDSSSRYIQKFFAQGAVPTVIYTFAPETTPDNAKIFKEDFLKEYGGVENAHKPQFLGGGSDVTVVGSELGQLALRDITGAHETRIAMRSEMPAVVLGVRESLAGSSLTTGNWKSARGQWSALWGEPYLDAWSNAMEKLFDVPGTVNGPSELSYDPKRIGFFKEDILEVSERIHKDGSTASLLVRDGWDWQSAVEYVRSGDIRQLEHTGLLPVQVHPPGEAGTLDDQPPATDNPSTDAEEANDE